MKLEHLNALDHQLSLKLDKNDFGEYPEIIRFSIDYITDLRKEEKITSEEMLYLIQTIKKLCLSFASGNIMEGDAYYRKVIENAKKIGQDILKILQKEDNISKPEAQFQEIALSDEDRENLKKYEIQKLTNEKMFYRGGKARIIGKYKLGLPITSYDHTEDVDMFLDPSLDKLEIAQSFHADTKGLEYIDIDEQKLFLERQKNTDCSRNQLVVGQNSLFISQACIESFNTGIIVPTGRIRNFYQKNIYQSPGGEIFTGKILRRLIKQLTDRRAEGFAIQKHNIEKSNLSLLNFEQNMLAHVRTYLDKSDEKQIEMYHILGHILVQLEIIQKKEEIFSYLSDVMENKFPEFTFVSSANPIKQECNRIIKKLFHLLKDKVAIDNNIYQTPLHQGYKFTSKEIVQIHNTSDTPKEEFITEYYQFKEQRKTRFTIPQTTQ